MLGNKAIIQTHTTCSTLLSNLTSDLTTTCSGYTIKFISNGDTIKLNRNLEPIPIPVRDIFIRNLGQNMHGILTDEKTVTVTYSGLDYLIYLGYLPKYPTNQSNIIECKRLHTEVIFRFVLDKNEDGTICYRLIKML